MYLTLYLEDGVSDVRRFTIKRPVEPKFLEISSYTVINGDIAITSRGVTVWLKRVNNHVYYDGGFYATYSVGNKHKNSRAIHAEYTKAQLPSNFTCDV